MTINHELLLVHSRHCLNYAQVWLVLLMLWDWPKGAGLCSDMRMSMCMGMLHTSAHEEIGGQLVRNGFLLPAHG